MMTAATTMATMAEAAVAVAETHASALATTIPLPTTPLPMRTANPIETAKKRRL
jgi:hypothetical protein